MIAILEWSFLFFKPKPQNILSVSLKLKQYKFLAYFQMLLFKRV